MKYVIVPLAVSLATAFVLGGLVERVRRDKAQAQARVQAHLEA
jgi:hypothetical protein